MNIRIVASIIGLAFLSLTNHSPKVGQIIDVYNGVNIHYNGKFTNNSGRNVTDDGYNLGLKYQCVEFVKRYYYKVYDHKMPNTYGHAREFFNKELDDVAFNKERGMWQYRNVRYVKPQVDDIVIYDKRPNNSFGHMAIISKIEGNEIELVQQNVGIKTREKLKLAEFQGIYTIADYDILGWLRLEP